MLTASVASDRLTWQLAVVPTRPEYWMATPCRPLLSKVVSSTIQCSMAPRFCIAGTTRPSTRSRTGPSFQLASLTKCWIDWWRRETFPLSSSAIGSMLLRSRGSSNVVAQPAPARIVACIFRLNPPSDFGGKRPPVSVQTALPFR